MRAILAKAATVTAPVARVADRIVRKHALAAVRHPHHYYTAAGITVGFYLLGHAGQAEITAAWLYAFVETAVTGDEIK